MSSVAQQLLKSFNLKTLAQASDLHKRFFFTLWIFIIYRFGTYVPLPGVDRVAMKVIAGDYTSQGVLKMFNVVSGGALERMSVFVLNLAPYISSSIIVQLMTAIFPYFMMLKKEGDSGKRKLTQYTRYGTILLASVQSVAIASFLSSQPGLVIDPGFFFYFSTIVTLVGATFFLMWLGEQITARGLGNGSSMLIYAGIIAGLPRAFFQAFELGRTGGVGLFEILLTAGGILAIIAFVVFVERAYRKVVVQYPRRQVGRQVYGAEQTYMPIKLNSTGVLPPIFAMTLISMFFMIANWQMLDYVPFLGSFLKFAFVESLSCSLLIKVALIIFFAFFYTTVVFNPEETSESLRKNGAFIPGYRPGVMTANYFVYLLNRLTFVGSLYIAFVVIFPDIVNVILQTSLPFAGTSILITVSVTLEMISQTLSHLISHQYGTLWRKGR
jgi:preprotein translocase subunit SecY